jgi:molybdate transport system substrate-binding protein
MRVLVAAVLAACSAIAVNTMSHAAEIRVISTNGMRDVIAGTKAEFERNTRHRLTVTVTETGSIRRRVQGGEAFDVIIAPREATDAFEQAGKLRPGTAVALVRVHFGLAVPSDGPRPDVSTPEGLKRTLLAAKTVLITDPTTGGISGVQFMEVLNKLGIADEMKGKLVPQLGGAFHAERVVRGEADLAAQAEHEIRCVRGATYLPYPAVLQRTIILMGGVATAARDLQAAKDYLAFLTSADTANAYKAHCLTRG